MKIIQPVDIESVRLKLCYIHRESYRTSRNYSNTLETCQGISGAVFSWLTVRTIRWRSRSDDK